VVVVLVAGALVADALVVVAAKGACRLLWTGSTLEFTLFLANVTAFCFVPIFIFGRFLCPDLVADMVLAAVVLVVLVEVVLIVFLVVVVLVAGALVADALVVVAAKGTCRLLCTGSTLEFTLFFARVTAFCCVPIFIFGRCLGLMGDMIT
jgi:hypothetical protein